MERIVFSDGRTFECAENRVFPIFRPSNGKSWRAITLTTTIDDAKSAFLSGNTFYREWEIEIVNDDGTISTSHGTEDMSMFTDVGEFVDHTDGRITVYVSMSNSTHSEEVETALKIMFGEVE